jgi:hypothetical protein
MKPFTLMGALIVSILVTCSNPQPSSAKTTTTTETYTATQHAAVIQGAATVAVVPQNDGMDEVISHYVHLKNALASDHSQEAATAREQLQIALVRLGKQSMNEAQKEAYDRISGMMKKNAKQVSEDGKNINRQREHFQQLSENIYDLVKAFGTSQTLYKDYCPMAKASWLSEVKSIKNPYFGKAMSTCGVVKETITP